MAAIWRNRDGGFVRVRQATLALRISVITVTLWNMKQIAHRFGKADLQRLGRHLRDLRLASGRTQGVVAAGRSNPNLPTVVALAAALETSIDRVVAAVAVARGRVAVTRAGTPGGDLSAGLDDRVLCARTVVLPQGTRQDPVTDKTAQAAVMVMVLEGVVLAIAATGERLRLDTGDTCHAQAGTLTSLAGLGPQTAQVICIADPRATP